MCTAGYVRGLSSATHGRDTSQTYIRQHFGTISAPMGSGHCKRCTEQAQGQSPSVNSHHLTLDTAWNGWVGQLLFCMGSPRDIPSVKDLDASPLPGQVQ